MSKKRSQTYRPAIESKKDNIDEELDEDTEYEHKHKSLLLKILLNTSPNGFERICRRLEIIGEAVKNLPYVFMVNYPEMKWKTLLG